MEGLGEFDDEKENTIKVPLGRFRIPALKLERIIVSKKAKIKSIDVHRIHRQLDAGKIVIVAAHGNSLRALVKHLDGISEEEIPNLNIPTGIPLVYELDGDLHKVTSAYLGDPAAAAAAAAAVANQASTG